ncbi:thiol-disulfide oxidoreductase DCC family protein [Xanthomonas hortorum]|uniref:Thiol-disulfide oxidoreductase DCC family protein n=1 Tax=Xanthomonas hortorum pv. pelargonii TaxID=453602 RepID=A0AAW9ZUX7_9XANT|nr:thiol-disulfide oxidoreductase DCC family protein [Xanthomonas hortorum]MCE4354833.1 thiol-disulfide oxidoreductase DCC family protein [Xanthomonas hortorum pv. pelargonii]MCM5523520.1 thiol-disulfide oxidoreductase DCC family protein [Xanthomonas hortorum pv. pelargonii]MCM5536163.1 thiol-disulfide oxidoreductase DCC family protein [Xanthomonas hortorum pv. pelargonii]MCM5540163.1 thiol-disulfide oxidoreductase DCC family protein [Xanthomonas hortorum pv. pelargonii]MCM5549770.1 thiol-disu
MDPPGGKPHAAPAIIVFDGVCLLCNGWVKFLLGHDRRGRYRFAAMQGQAGRALLLQHGLDPDDPLSFLLVDVSGAWTDSDAIVRVLAGLGGIWRLATVLRVVPSGVRDIGYRLIARNRYRWFGRTEHCMLPSPEQRARFLD